MLILQEKKVIFRKLFFSFLFILILSISVFGVVKTIQKYANAAEVYVTGDGNYASYGVYGNGSTTAQTDQYKVRGNIVAYCANPSKLGLNTGYYTIGSAPSGYYDSIRLLIYLSTVGYSSHSSESIMTTLFGSDKSNSTMRYVLTHIAIGAMYANDRSYLSSQGNSQATAIINGLSSYINSNGSAYAESKNYSLYRIADTSERQALIWIEQNATPTPTPTPGKVRAIKESSSSTDEPSFAGIEFSLYTTSSCKSAIDTKTISGSSDRVVFDDDIEVGEVYYIKETDTNDNYYLTDTSCKKVTATATGTGTGSATFTNEPIPQSNPGKVRAIKESSSSTYEPSFAGIEFTLYKRSSCTGTIVDTKTISGSSDRVVFDDDIEVGEVYYIKETDTNDNYYLTDTSCQKVTATASGTGSSATATFTNNPIVPGKVTAVKKSSSNTLTPSFAGIKFSIYSSSSCSGSPIATKTLSGSNSSVTFDTNLTEGTTYYIKESIGTNTNYYETDTSCKSATATENGTESSATVTFTNEPIPQSNPGKVRAVKESSSSTYTPSFAGIKFGLYSSSSCSGDPITTKTLSGSNSSVTFDENIEVDDIYYIKETATNNYYYLTDTSCKKVTATATGTESSATGTFTNNPIVPGKVTVIKESSSDTHTPPFAGIKFSIYSSSSCSGDPIAAKTLSVNENNVIFDTNLIEGTTYYVKESIGTNTEYYETDTACKSVTATATGTESSATLTFTNNPIIVVETPITPGKVTAKKESKSTTYVPSFDGIEFSLYNNSNCSGDPISTKSLSDGYDSVQFDTGLEENETYYIKESIGTNTNYHETETACKSVSATVSGEETFATATFVNEPIGKIKVNKCDAEINSDCASSSLKAQGNGNFNGIEFTLYNNAQCTELTTATGLVNPQTLSNNNISIIFEKLVAGQTYYVKENISNNTFYNASDASCKAVTASTSSSSDINFNNTIKKTSIKVNKRDSETNSCTPVGNNSFDGTSFQLINKSANSIYYNNAIFAPNSVIDTKTLASNSCEVTFENLPYGAYQISETPSNGYNGGAAQTVTLSSPEATEITFTNTAKKGQIIVNKIDADTNSCTPYNGNFPLDGTSFTLTNKTGGLVYHDSQAVQNNDVIMTQTLSNGICQVTFENLPYGDYEITEEPTFGYIPSTPTTQLVTISEEAKTITKTFENRFVAQSLGTVAADGKDGDKFVEAESSSKIIDTVSYCVIPGIDFVLEGTLMDKSTGEELLIDGNPVKSSIPLNATTECGEIKMEFELDTTNLGGQDIVVFEKLYYKDTLVLEHSDINDTDQTLSVLFLRTFATNRSTKKKLLPLNEEVEIVDEVNYCLKTDLEYTLEGTIMDKSTGDQLIVDDAPVEDELTFTPTECCGQVEMKFTLNTKDLAGAELVIFENLYQDDQLVLEHNNLYNVDQTVHVETPLPAPEPVPDLISLPNTGELSKDNDNISESFNIVLVACTAFAVGIIGYLIYRKISRVSFSHK